MTLDLTSSSSEARANPLEDDIFASKYIRRKGAHAFELGLFQTKWFDYRVMTPAAATREFINQYGIVYKQMYAEMLDRERASFVQPMTVERIEKGIAEGETKALRFLAGCWRSRQVADAIGIPYRQFVRLAIELRMRHWQRASLPQPTQLYTDHVIERLVVRWEELQKARLFTSDLAAYSSQNYCGAAYQNDYHDWLINQATLRGNETEILANMIFNGAVPREKVQSRVGEKRWEQVQKRLH